MQPDLLSQVLPRNVGPSGLTTEASAKTDAQSDLRMGVVTAVTTRGITVDVGAQTISASHLDSYAPAVGDPVALMKVQDSWLAMGRVVGPGNVSDFSNVGPSIGPSFIGGGMVTTSLSASTSAGPVSIPGYDITFYLPANHSALVLAGMPFFGSTAGNVGQMTLVNNGVGNISQLRRSAITGSIAQQELVAGVVVSSPVARTVRVIGQIQFISGTGTVAVQGFTVVPGFMIVLDLGDTSFTPTK